MATTGQIDTNITYDSFFWVYWSQVSQDVANNKTTIYWSCGVTCGHDFFANAIRMSAVYINGSMVYSGGTYSNFSTGEHRIANGYLDIYHDPNGTKTFDISSFTGWLYANYSYSSGGDSFELTPIPRKATLESATDFTDLTNPTVTYSNPASDSATSLHAFIYATDGEDILVDKKDLNKNGTSGTLSPTDAEIEKLRKAAKSGSIKVHFFIRTMFGVEAHWSGPIEKTFTVEESDATKPQVTLGVSVDNSSLLSKFAGMYIQGKSKVTTTVTATGKYDATISKLYATIEGKTYQSGAFTSDALKNSGTVKVTGYAKDSRGFTGSATRDLTVIPYSKPLVIPLDGETAIQCYRSDAKGKRDGSSTSVWIKAKRYYHSVSGKNTCVLKWRCKVATEAWNDQKHTWANLRSKTDTTDGYSALISSVTFDAEKAYTIQIAVQDDIGGYDIRTLDLPTRAVALHLGKGCKNVSVGSYCDYTEDYTFHSEWKTILDRELVVKGVASLDGGAKINGQQITNFVVAHGTEGIWTYRKWADGTAECWGIYEQTNVAVATAYGALYESAGFNRINLPSGLFVETPQFNITMVGSQAAILDVYEEGSAIQIPLMNVVRGTPKTIERLHISIVAYGRWK